jgi:hypothetical protein
MQKNVMSKDGQDAGNSVVITTEEKITSGTCGYQNVKNKSAFRINPPHAFCNIYSPCNEPLNT